MHHFSSSRLSFLSPQSIYHSPFPSIHRFFLPFCISSFSLCILVSIYLFFILTFHANLISFSAWFLIVCYTHSFFLLSLNNSLSYALSLILSSFFHGLVLSSTTPFVYVNFSKILKFTESGQLVITGYIQGGPCPLSQWCTGAGPGGGQTGNGPLHPFWLWTLTPSDH